MNTYTSAFKPALGLGQTLGAWMRALADEIAVHRNYLRTKRELESLSDRELADIGLSRHMIDSVSRESSYGLFR